MKKAWKKPICLTLKSNELSAHIKAAAHSGCDFFVIR